MLRFGRLVAMAAIRIFRALQLNSTEGIPAMIRKTLIAFAALAACGIASAQSNVQLFGVVDAAIQHGSGSIASKSSLGNSGLNNSRLGVRGTEDLGGGLWAGFWLESGINSDNGTGQDDNTNNQASGAVASGNGLVFNRRSTVSLGGPWGEVRAGRDYSLQYMNLLTYDPTGASGVGTGVNLTNIITGPTARRASNQVTYFSPKFGGFFGQAQYYLGENASNAPNKDDGSGYSLRAGYGQGAWELAAATSKTKYLSGDSKQSNIGGSYDFKLAKVMANYSHDEGLIQASAAPVGLSRAKANGWLLGTSVPWGNNEFRAAYSKYDVDVKGALLNDPEAKKWMLSYIYNFSKRTAAYGTYARVSNSGGWTTALNGAITGPNESSSGYEVGLRHSF
jgi:predicted porin